MGVRHLLPIYPFCIVLASAAAASLFNRSLVGRVAVTALFLFTLISSLHAYPNFLVYSNELFGDPSHTYRYAVDANADWGQGLKWTRTWLDEHPDTNCWFDYHGNFTVNPAYYGISCKPLLSGIAHSIGFSTAPIPTTITGTVLISSSEISGQYWGTRQPQSLSKLPRPYPPTPLSETSSLSIAAPSTSLFWQPSPTPLPLEPLGQGPYSSGALSRTDCRPTGSGLR